jgi:hypothetical protein
MGWSEPVEAKSTAAPEFAALREFLTSLLLANDLAVLAGLGTSIGLSGKDGRAAPTMTDLWSTVASAVGDTMDKVVAEVGYETPPSGDNIELLMSRCQSRLSLEDVALVSEFLESAESLIADSCRFVDDFTDLNVHEAFLRKVARRDPDRSRMQLFTTNYDLAFEFAANRSGFLTVDGFSFGQPSEFDGTFFDYDFVHRRLASTAIDLVPNVFQIFKLHGSVNWQSRAGRIEKAHSPTKPLLIYPADSKFRLTYDQPFLENMSRFQLALRKPSSAVIVVGSGLGDAHLAQPLRAAVHANVSQMYLVVAPRLEDSSSKLVLHLQDLIREGDARIVLLEATFAELVELMPMIHGQSDHEAHQGRIHTVETRTSE